MWLALLLACTDGGSSPAGWGRDEGAPEDAGGSDEEPIVEGDIATFYADGAVQNINLLLSEESLAALRSDARTWVPGTFIWESFVLRIRVLARGAQNACLK